MDDPKLKLKKIIYMKPRLQMILNKMEAFIKQEREATGTEVSAAFSAFRDQSKKLWLLDKIRDRGIEWTIDGFTNQGRPIMRFYIRKDSGHEPSS